MATTELEQAKGALAMQWVRAVRVATKEFHFGMQKIEARSGAEPAEGGDLPELDARDEILFEITNWLTDQAVRATCDIEGAPAAVLGKKFEFSGDQLEALIAIRDRTRSPVFNQRTTAAPFASALVDHAARCVTGLTPSAFSPDARAEFLVADLTRRVHAGFSELKGRPSDVLALLRRFEPDRHRRRTKRGEPSKLSADGILEAINDLAGRPLGEGALSANAIGAAKRREKRQPR